MNFWKKLKETGIAMAPIVLLVLIIHVFFHKFQAGELIRFFISSFLIAVGEVLFLSGTDNSIMPMGEMVGNQAGTIKHVSILIIFAFMFGLFATVAEPDVNVLGTEAVILGFKVSKTAFMFIIGAGVGLFIAFSLIRILSSFSYKAVVMIVLLLLFIVSSFVPNNLVAVAFDAGGATTGIVTSPFLLAITAGICKHRSRKSHSDNFGVIGITSLGPILAILILSLLGTTGAVHVNEAKLSILGESLMSSIMAIAPLMLVFYLFDLLFIKLPKKKKLALAFGSFVTFTGLFLFLFGINFGFLHMGEAVGEFLGTVSTPVFFVICLLVGFVITFTEPAIRVLGAQVEDITQGNVTRNGVTISIAIAMMVAVLLAGIKIIFNIPILYILIVGYGLICLLMFFTPKTFTAIAFDSGGVASGPMTASFVLPLMLGFAESTSAGAEGFGLIAIVSMMPILVLNILGIVYRIKIIESNKQRERIALRIAYAERAYSNMDKLEEEYSKRHANVEVLDEDEEETKEIILD